MSTSSPADGVRSLVAPLAERAGLVLENVAVVPAGRRRIVRVIVDLPAEETGGVPMDTVAQVSRDISVGLDESDVLGDAPYVLEVSSPGIDRPLTERRHWLRARGRLVKVQRRDGGAVSGRLSTVDDAGVGLADGTAIGWDEVLKGRVEVDFSAVPDDDEADGPDEEGGGV